MTLKNLLSRNGWLTIKAALLNDYPKQLPYIHLYEEVYYRLLLLPEGETDLHIELKTVWLTNGNACYVDVYGRKWPPHIADADLLLYYALDFTPWAEWLAMPVSLKTFYTFSEAEIIAHCLHTMTRFSFNENNIKEERERLSDSLVVMDIFAG